MKFYVDVVRRADGRVVERMGPMEGWKADKVKAGLDINLDHGKYYVSFTKAEKERRSK